jgi:hypothetical protein
MMNATAAVSPAVRNQTGTNGTARTEAENAHYRVLATAWVRRGVGVLIALADWSEHTMNATLLARAPPYLQVRLTVDWDEVGCHNGPPTRFELPEIRGYQNRTHGGVATEAEFPVAVDTGALLVAMCDGPEEWGDHANGVE